MPAAAASPCAPAHTGKHLGAVLSLTTFERSADGARGAIRRMLRRLSRAVTMASLLAAVAVHGGEPAADGPTTDASAEDATIRKVIADYGRAIETKDVDLFKAVKPNLTSDEERRMRSAFEAVKSQVVKITVVSLDVQGADAVVRVSRRDTINGSLVSSFPQTLRLARGKAGWVIQEIGK